jgi:dolichol-phosphate mannosyltransferase
MKVMKRECLEGVVLFGQLHRFLLLFISSHGYQVGEVPITHAPRAFGKSKYGNERIYQGLMDLIAVIYLTRFSQSPLYLFGFWGLACLAFALVFGGLFIGMHIISLVEHLPHFGLSQHPIWILSPITGLLGFIFIFIGLLAEMLYFLIQPRDKTAIISRRLGFGDADPER